MSENQVPIILHFRRGETERVMSSPVVDSERQTVSVSRGDATSEEIPFSDLKALFFLRDPAAGAADESAESNQGSTLSVEFRDGEVIRGRSREYNPERNGFFLYPLDRSKLEKIYVVNSAIVSIEIEKF